MGDQNNSLCNACSGPACSNAKLHKCNSCDKFFHTACMKLASVSIKYKPCEARSTCIARTIPSLPSLSTTRSRNTSNSSISEAAGSTCTSDGVLDRILEEFTELKTLIEVTIDARFNNFEVKLSQIDELGARVKANEASHGAVTHGFGGVKKELATMKKKIEDREEHIATGDDDSIMLDRVLDLGKKIAELSTRLATVSARNLFLSNYLVIGGLMVPSGCDLKTVTTAVLASVHLDIDTVRTLMSKAVMDKFPVPTGTKEQHLTQSYFCCVFTKCIVYTCFIASIINYCDYDFTCSSGGCHKRQN